MAKRLPLIFLLALHLLLSGVLSTSIITIENKCNHTVWPVIFSWNIDTQVFPTGFALRRGEARAIHAPSSWYGLISARTLCSTDSTGKFSCVTGDCESGTIECPGNYGWAPVTYVYFRINNGGINSYTTSLEYGYNLPLMVVPSQRTRTCISAGCVVELNKTCPKDLMKLSRENLVACSSTCMEFDTPETCCTRDFKSKQNCKPTVYTQNFERACPLAQIYAYDDNNSTVTCLNSTDYVITFCPSSNPNKTK
ncbi:Thaumatin family [Arabidopsis thaliana x Arabidopsis arenosa]|uniref:Thaumatin family n=1 Tax=Arabidopsis thaliana x Arabidopsis arenosa TaxID=1240361 RepID=A0A8T1Y835_9BRAS|nr:Thaumatin family [Arabidopsis thaliana x Arabidopsis arenosa]